LWDLFASAKPSAANHILRKMVLAACKSIAQEAVEKSGVSFDASDFAAADAAAAAAYDREAAASTAGSEHASVAKNTSMTGALGLDACRGTAGRLVAAQQQLLRQEAAAKAAVRAYVAAAVHNAPSVPATMNIADAAEAAVLQCLYRCNPWVGFSPQSVSQVLCSLQMDLVQCEGAHEELLGGWLGAEGELQCHHTVTL
jgi:hypothetical protein